MNWAYGLNRETECMSIRTKSLVKHLLKRLRRWEENANMNPTETACESWRTDLAQNYIQWQPLFCISNVEPSGSATTVLDYLDHMKNCRYIN
jgi:hypothetical protein